MANRRPGCAAYACVSINKRTATGWRRSGQMTLSRAGHLSPCQRSIAFAGEWGAR